MIDRYDIKNLKDESNNDVNSTKSNCFIKIFICIDSPESQKDVKQKLNIDMNVEKIV